MPKRSKAETDTLVTVAAGIFATHTRDAKEIANLLNTTERNVHRWAEREKWEEVLQTLNYEGERNFRIKPILKPANLIKLHIAAFHFAKTPDCTAQELAQVIDVKIDTVQGWVQHPEWHAALDALHFTGDRAFARKPTRDTLRDTGGLVEKAFEIYKVAREDGHTPKKAVSAVVNEMGLKRRRINTWAERYEWEAALKAD